LSVRAVVRDATGREIPDASVTWSSADTTIAVVSATGEISSVRPGTADIRARSGDLAASLPLTIRRLTVLKVSLLGLFDTLGAGDVVVVSVRAHGEGGREVKGRPIALASTNPDVALIDPAGRVRAVSAGPATISATVDGVAGTWLLEVVNDPSELALRQLDGTRVPTLVGEGWVELKGGSFEYREFYLEQGNLELFGGSQPRYATHLHYASYAVSVDSAGQKHFLLRTVFDARDHGVVQYDARGDLAMTSDLIASLSHMANATTGGFTMAYHVVDVNTPLTLFFRREPK
jgi:hypothetical protein